MLASRSATRIVARYALPSTSVSIPPTISSIHSSVPPTSTRCISLATGLSASPHRRSFSAPTTVAAKVSSPSPGATASRVPTGKVHETAAEALKAAGLKDGQTLSANRSSTIQQRTVTNRERRMLALSVACCPDTFLSTCSALQTCRRLRSMRYSHDSHQRCA